MASLSHDDAFSIASDRAVFAKPEIQLGMPPTFGGTQRLTRLAGRKRALELLLTGDSFPPARALELGLVNQMVPHAALMPAARELAGRILRQVQEGVERPKPAVSFEIGDTLLQGQTLLVVVASVVLIIVLYLFFERTLYGKALA